MLALVTVIDTTGGPIQPDITVVIRGDRIKDMGKNGEIRVPPDSQVVNASGKFLIPGLRDMNVYWYDPPEYLPLFIANGVTGVREGEVSVPKTSSNLKTLSLRPFVRR